MEEIKAILKTAWGKIVVIIGAAVIAVMGVTSDFVQEKFGEAQEVVEERTQ